MLLKSGQQPGGPDGNFQLPQLPPIGGGQQLHTDPEAIQQQLQYSHRNQLRSHRQMHQQQFQEDPSQLQDEIGQDELEEEEEEDVGGDTQGDDISYMDDSQRIRRQRAKERVRAQMMTKRKKKFEVNYTVGRIEDGDAILLSSEHNILNMPLSLLP